MVTSRASVGMFMDALSVSVGFFAVADVRPTRERQGRCRQREASDSHDPTGQSDHEESFRPSIGVMKLFPRLELQ